MNKLTWCWRRGRKYKNVEPCNATSKQINNRNRIFKATGKVELYTRCTKLALKWGVVVTFFVFWGIGSGQLLTRKTLLKCATLWSLVQKFLPRKAMTAISFKLFQPSLTYTGNVSVVKARAYYHICINVTGLLTNKKWNNASTMWTKDA